MSSIKDRNRKDLTEAEKINKRWQEYREQYKKGFNDPDNYGGTVTHLEPDILVCEVKWALGNITMNKASGGDRILDELFKIPKDDAVKVRTEAPKSLWTVTAAMELKDASFLEGKL